MRLNVFAIILVISFSSFCQPGIIVLGIAQDGGYPHIGCQNECQLAWEDPALRRFVVSLAVIDPESKRWWMLEATPDFKEQLNYFQKLTNSEYPYLPSGIFLTHAHVGHYTGLIHLGREALGSKNVPVYVLPKFKAFIENDGPWSQLVALQNIELRELVDEEKLNINDRFRLITHQVPHRDEFSETAGFRILLNEKSYLFIPDIDKWSKWDKDILEEVEKVDVAFLDGSFYADGELPNRSISEVPHPFVSETMKLFEKESLETRKKIHFIHFNHTNPILWNEDKRKETIEQGFSIAEQGKKY